MASIIFLTVFSLLYFLANWYLYKKIFISIPNTVPNQWINWLKFGFYFFSTSFIICHIIDKLNVPGLTMFFQYAGSFWFAILLYGLLFILVFDILGLLQKFFKIYPEYITKDMVRTNWTVLYSTAIFIFCIILYGYFNAAKPKVRYLNLEITGKKTNLKELKIALATDIHLGALVNKKKLQKLVKIMNTWQPDMVWLAGDILDEIHSPIATYDIGAPLRDLKTKMGVYACTGNHEYIGGIETAESYIKSLNIKLLRDSFITFENGFILAGREDKESKNFSSVVRKPLNELLSGVDKSLPIFVMDHQPYHLDSAQQNGVDLQVSGHTHHGQMWPLNFATKAIYELSHGYLKKGNTNYYVSNGYGTWGPPVRIGNRPEIVLITIKFKP